MNDDNDDDGSEWAKREVIIIIIIEIYVFASLHWIRMGVYCAAFHIRRAPLKLNINR